MLKILLVYDDFQELTAVELMLKKIGFDVLGITSEFSLAEQLLSFNPQIVIAQGRSPKVSSAGVGKRLRESLRWDGQCILIFYPNAKPHPADILKMRMDVGLEYPVEPTKMVQVIAQLGGLDSNQLLDKLIKNMSQGTADGAEGSTTGSGYESRSGGAVYVSGGKHGSDSTSQTIGSNALDQESRSVTGEVNQGGRAQSTLTGGSVGTDAAKAVKGQNSEGALAKDIRGSGSETDAGRSVRGENAGADASQDVGGQKDRESQRTINVTDEEIEKNAANFSFSAPLEQLDKEALDSELNSTKNNQDQFPLNPKADSEKPALNPFQMETPKDPLLQELEDLLQNKAKTPETPTISDAKRARNYAQFLSHTPPLELDSISRREAKARMRDMVKNISKESLRDQDDLRRDYVKALFKRST